MMHSQQMANEPNRLSKVGCAVLATFVLIGVLAYTLKSAAWRLYEKGPIGSTLSLQHGGGVGVQGGREASVLQYFRNELAAYGFLMEPGTVTESSTVTGHLHTGLLTNVTVSASIRQSRIRGDRSSVSVMYRLDSEWRLITPDVWEEWVQIRSAVHNMLRRSGER